ncbi:MAG TPA: ATP-binding protein [Polyangiaceae bacterium]|nr:ATP-binding protein [Polyangiaceae bacterium]
MRRELKKRAARGKTLSLQSEPVPSGQHARVEANAHLQAELLQLALDLPIDVGEDQVTNLCLDRLSRMLPDCALGAVVQKPNAAQPRISVRLPSALAVEASTGDARLFPGLPHERIIPLTDAGATLHIAGSEVNLFAEPSFESAWLNHAAQVVGTGIVRARSFEQAELAALELRRLQAKFIQAEKLASLGQLVAGVVHELNNPLTSIVNYSEHLLARLSAGAPTLEDRERIQRIAEAAERILKFSRALVLYARPARHEPCAVGLRDVIEKALIFCEHEFVENQVRIDLRLPAELPAVRGVFDQLTQVFVNLFTNAAHAMHGRGGTLCIAAAGDAQTERVVVEVVDQGAGIDPSALEQIFEPFFSTKPDGRGTGLGLSIVQDVLQAHGGSIQVSSALGQGSTFRLCLPLA